MTTSRWLGSWRLALRLARADARRHRIRTLLAVLLVGLPTALGMALGVFTLGEPSSVQAALRRVPDGAQARIQATPYDPGLPPLAQPPEGFFVPLPVLAEQPPVSQSQIEALLPTGAELHPFWTSGNMLLVSGDFDPFAEEVDFGTARVQTSRFAEADSVILPMLRAELVSGNDPTAPGEVVLGSELADRLGLGIGDELTIFGAPPTGWIGLEGYIDKALAEQSMSFTITGLTTGSDELVWALPGWLSAAIEADSAGINQSYLLLGDEPLRWAQVKQLNELQAWAISRDVLENYPEPGERYPTQPDPSAVLAALVGVVIGTLTTLAVLLFTITPAFTVSAEQSQRSLGLIAAAGGAPADLRRVIQAQGLLVGLVGGILGAVLGTIGGFIYLRLAWPEDPPATLFPWPLLPLAFFGAAVAGWAAALAPARRVARAGVLRALAGRPLQGRNPVARHWWVGPALIGLGAVVAVASLKAEPVNSDLVGLMIAPVWAATAVAVAVVLIGAGALASLPLIFTAVNAIGGRLGVGSRLALADAQTHRGRAWPAAAAILMATMAVTVLPIQISSARSNDFDSSYPMAAAGHLVAGMNTPVSDSFDEQVLAMGAEQLGGVVERHPIYAWAFQDRQPGVLLDAEHTCPSGQLPTAKARILRDHPFECSARAQGAGFGAPWMLGGDVLVMSPAALRSSGLPGAEAAADVLAAGGVVVNAAYAISADDQVHVGVGGRDPMTAELDPETEVWLPGAYLPHFGGSLTMTPETAAALGLELPRMVGEYWQTDRPVGPVAEQIDQNRLRDWWSLIFLTANHRYGDPTTVGQLGLLIAIAVGATVISLALARNQIAADLSTMAAAGATPGFVRRFGLLQSGVLLAAGVPVGAALGIAIGSYWVAWQRQLSVTGEWRLTMIPWGQLLAIWGLIVAGALLGALLIGRRLPELVRRRLD